MPCLVYVVFSCSAPVAGAQGTLLRVAGTHPLAYPTVQAITYMGELLKDWSSGEVLLKVCAGGQLGEEKDSLELGKFDGLAVWT